jgi:hypothetical protein
LISTLDLAWTQPHSISDQEARKYLEQEEIIKDYTKAIDSRIREEAALSKDTFRVMPYHYSNQSTSPVISARMRDSLDEASMNRERYRSQSVGQVDKNHLVDSGQRKPIQNSSNLSSTVFGYNINYDNFKQESYLSKLLSDRLEPYLNKLSPPHIKARHTSLSINHPVPNYYV